MAKREFHLHDGKKGAALGVRITPRASKDEIAEILPDGTIRIRLNAAPGEKEINEALLKFLSSILEVTPDRIEVVAGYESRDKLVSVLDVDAETTQRKILENLA
jgi:uncharacterized protein YggU (UPF0235/DUF167 family)